MAINYRDAYGIYATNGILFNHESPLRPPRFVTKKIIIGACDIKRGSAHRLQLGDIEVYRDWGAAPEYVEAMWQMMQLEKPTDLVVASGRSHSLKEFVAVAFAELGLDWRQYVDVGTDPERPSDIRYSGGNPEKARRVLGWQARTSMPDLVRMMLRDEMEQRP
jgi:GDPmannose 4,6-dehydratase